MQFPFNSIRICCGSHGAVECGRITRSAPNNRQSECGVDIIADRRRYPNMCHFVSSAEIFRTRNAIRTRSQQIRVDAEFNSMLLVITVIISISINFWGCVYGRRLLRIQPNVVYTLEHNDYLILK